MRPTWPNPAKRGGGPRTKKKAKALQARRAAEHLQEIEEKRAWRTAWKRTR